MTRQYLVVPVQIGEGDVVKMHFPADITPAEAETVARVIRAYAVEPEDSTAIPLAGGEG